MFRMRRPKSKTEKRQHRDSEVEEIKLLESWINSGKPNSGSNPLLFPALPEKSPVGPLPSGSFSPYAGAAVFQQLPLSIKTKKGLASEKYVKMTDIQRASLPHALCGRDVLGAAKTGSGKTLAFVIPVLETLYRVRWGPEDGVGCIILSPTRELASQLFGVVKGVGKYHGFSAGLLIGGRKGVDTEKEHVNHLNILVSTPGRLLQHMDETPNFDCSQLQILVLDEADRLLDVGFKAALNAIISQLPKRRQTLLFSATQTKSVEDLQRLALKDQEYISVHEEAPTATPDHLEQKAVIVPLDEKLDVLWSFIKRNLNSRILVFLSTCKQVKYVFEAFKKLHPGIPLKCLHGRMNQEKRLVIYEQFCDTVSVLFSTDVASRGLDFKKAVDWVVQVDCPDDVASYIHRVGRTARYYSGGKSILFLTPSETKMFERLQERKIPIRLSKANQTRLQPVSRQLEDLLVKYPDLRSLAQRAFITYLKSIHKQRDKDVFDVTKLPFEKFAESLGLPLIPKVRFLKQKVVRKKSMQEPPERNADQITFESSRASIENGMHVETGLGVEDVFREKDDQHDDLFFQEKSNQHVVTEEPNHPGDHLNTTGISKKRKKLKININRPGGTRVVFDDEGNSMHPLAKLSEVNSDPDSVKLDMEKVSERYAKMKEEMKVADKEDKALDRQRMREKRIKQKIKMKKRRGEDIAPSNTICELAHENKKPKIDDDINPTAHRDAITIAEQEELALKLLSSMHS